MLIRKIIKQVILILWIGAVLGIFWVVQPGPAYRQLAEHIPYVAKLGDVLNPLFYRKYIY